MLHNRRCRSANEIIDIVHLEAMLTHHVAYCVTDTLKDLRSMMQAEWE